MSDYHFYNEIKIQDSDIDISNLYAKGYKFTRKAPGNMQSTKSIRVNLENFELNSENRRVLSKFPTLSIRSFRLPFIGYDYTLGKWMKDFYVEKFGEKLFGIQTIKNLFSGNLNMNAVLQFTIADEVVGYCLIYQNEGLIHYCYPFYKLDWVNKNLGMAMMVRSVEYARNNSKKYIYLGGYNTERDKYKLQFKGVEWWDEEGQGWENDLDQLI